MPGAKPKYTASGQFKPSDKVAVAPSQKSIQQIQDESRAAKLKGPKAKDEAKTDDEKDKSQRIKKPPINPAAEGAKLDRKGIKYSSEKGNKSFFTKRKQNIERVNEKLGFGPSQENEDEEDMTEWQGGNTK